MDTLPPLQLPLKKSMHIPFEKEVITIDYDEKSYTPTAHTTILQINNFSINKNDTVGAVIGTGSGLDAIAMVKKGMPKVVATDIDPYTLAVAKHNSEINNVSKDIEFKLGDMFSPLQNNTFDIIFSSPPCFPVPQNKQNDFPWYINGGLDGTKYLELTLEHAMKFLKPNGRLYLNFSSTTNPQKLFSILDRYYQWKELARINLPFSEQFLQIWEYLKELQKQDKAEIWEEYGVPYRWYSQIEAEVKP